MALLGGICYDPASAVSKATSSRLAMTAFDTTNLRLTFTTPTNGYVMVRIRCCVTGAATYPCILLGVLESTTVIARQVPMGAQPGAAIATNFSVQEALFCIAVSAGSHTWDAAYGVEILLAATNIKYGGPNNASGANAWGGIVFEIWDCNSILGAKLYDPAIAATKSDTSLLAMTVVDTTNLRITFTAPSSGKVLVRMRVCHHGSATIGALLLGVLDGATVRVRTAPIAGWKSTSVSTQQIAYEGQGIVTGLSGSYTWDMAYAVQVVSGGGGLKYGGPDNTTTDDAFGGCLFEIWAI